MAELTRTHALSRKSTKPISSLTKQTGSIRMDNPTNSKRQGDEGQGAILQTHTDTHTQSLPRILPSSTAKAGIFLPSLSQIFLQSAGVTSHP